MSIGYYKKKESIEQFFAWRYSKYVNKGQKDAQVQVVPIELAGKWVAWSADHKSIISSANSLQEARQKAFDLGEKTPWLDKVPDGVVRFGGAAFRG